MRSSRMSVFRGVALMALTGWATVSQADADAVARGNTKFQAVCAPCHAAGGSEDGTGMLPGTYALYIKYQGALPAVLEERQDLTVSALREYVRHGVMSMPPFRPTEVTDTDLEDIAAYLAESAKSAE